MSFSLTKLRMVIFLDKYLFSYSGPQDIGTEVFGEDYLLHLLHHVYAACCANAADAA